MYSNATHTQFIRITSLYEVEAYREQMDNEVDHKKLIKAIKIGFWQELQKPKAPSYGETLNL